jgi:hypothetical protein
MAILIKAGADVNARITDTTSLTARIARASTMTNREGQTTLFSPYNQAVPLWSDSFWIMGPKSMRWATPGEPCWMPQKTKPRLQR